MSILFLTPLLSKGSSGAPAFGEANQCYVALNSEEPSFQDPFLNAEDPEWVRTSVRNPDEPVLDIRYLTRLNYSLNTVFAEWFFNGSESYTQILQKQHLVANTDENGQAFYLGASFRDRNKNKRMMTPGQYTCDMQMVYGRTVHLAETPVPDSKKFIERIGNMPIPYSEKLSPASARRLSEVLASLRPKNANRNAPEWAKDAKDPSQTFSYTLSLPRMGSVADVRNDVNLETKTIIHRYVKFNRTKQVVAKMGDIMNEIRKLPANTNKADLVNLLAQFTYLGINVHPFDGANFSVLMSQVNWVLRLHGFQGISHGFLDFAGMYLPFEDFKVIMNQAILDSNTSPEHPKTWENNFTPSSPNFKTVSVRDPQKPLLDDGYLPRLHDSITKAFGPWFDGSGVEKSLNYEKMMRLQHRILVSGFDGSQEYQGASRREHNVASGFKVKPGFFRFDSPNTEGRIKFKMNIKQVLGEDASPEIKYLAAVYEQKFGRLPEATTEATGNSKLADNAIVNPILLPRVGSRVKVWNAIEADNVDIFYPTNADSKLMMNAMGDIMNELRMAHPVRTSTERVVHLLTEYAYLASWAHLGMGANFSLAMSQVAYIAHKWGFNSFSHANLDYVAVTSSFDYFEALFRERLLAANSENPAMNGIVVKPRPTNKWIPTELHFSLHISDISKNNDQEFSWGDFGGDPIVNRRIEGLTILTTGLPNGLDIEYQVESKDAAAGSWHRQGEFAGTTGLKAPIPGMALRLSGPSAPKYILVYQMGIAPFKSSHAHSSLFEWLPPAANGAWTANSNDKNVVAAVKIWLYQIQN